MMQNSEQNTVMWYAMSATYRNELKARDTLASLGIESYLALVTKVVERCGKKKTILAPAVSNLIFVHTDLFTLQKVKLTMPYLQYKVYREEGTIKKIIVRDNDMEAFMKVTNGESNIEFLEPEFGEINVGERVKVICGSLEGLEGTLVQSKGRKSPMVVVTLDKLLAVGVTIPRKDIRKI